MLKKLSLAALLTLGSASLLSAQPLTEAIKNVNVSGYTKLRVYADSDAASKTRYRTQAVFKFCVPVSEELKFKTAYSFDWSMYGTGATLTSGDNRIGNSKMFLQYSNGALTALVGKIAVPTPVTGSGIGEATAAGAIAMYNAGAVTFAAAALDDMVNTDVLDSLGKKNENTLAVAALFKSDMVNAQLWAFKVTNTINYDAVLMASANVTENVKVNLDFAVAELDKSISDKTQTYFNISAKAAAGAACAKVGFAKTGKDGGTVVLDADSPLASVLPTQQYTGIANTADDYAVYAKAGAKLDAKTKVYLAAAKADKAFNYEVALGCSHKYTNKFTIDAYLSQADTAGKDNDNFEFSASFKYSF